MVGSEHVARQSEVVELVDQADVDARGARRAVVAVDAAPGHLLRSQAVQHRTVLLDIRRVEEAKKDAQVGAVAHA